MNRILLCTGVAVRTNPTQLATPLVPARRLSSANAPPPPPQATPLADDNFSHNLLFPSPPSSTSGGFAQRPAPPPPQFPSQPPSGDRFHSMDHISSHFGVASAQQQPPVPPMGAAADLFPRVERSANNTLVGVSPKAASPATRAFNQNFENLFGPPDPTPLPPVPVRSTQSFSYGHTTHENPHVQQPQQQSQYQAPRGFSQPPPPAAPFLGYADSSRTQSTTSLSSSSAATGASPRVNLHQRTNSGSLGALAMAAAAPSPRIHAQVRTADDLLEEFLHVSVEDQYLTNSGSSPLFPDTLMPAPTRLTLADVPDTVQGLEQLYRQKRWKTLTKKSLSMLQNPQNDAALTIEIKSWWLAGLIKDGHYDNATSVLDQIGDLDDPALVAMRDPFVLVRLRLLEALLFKYKGNAGEHEKKLFQLIARVRQAITQGDESARLGCSTDTAWTWLRITQFALVNHLVLQNKFSLALRVTATIEVSFSNHSLLPSPMH
jgi:hypothetical protein